MPVFPLETRRNLHAVIGGALGVVFVGATLILTAAPARAQDDSIEAKVLDGIMGVIGLSRKPGDQIEYRERSPLVLPQSNNLPAPESNKITNPNWPVEPEVKEAKALAAAEHSDDGRTSSQRMEDAKLPLSHAELERGRTNRRQHNPNVGDRSLERSSWSELGYKGGIFGHMFDSEKEETASFTGEAPRASLLAPPSGYQTPSPAQPYALGKSTYKDKAIDPMERTYDR
jgi:hypothetical protein